MSWWFRWTISQLSHAIHISNMHRLARNRSILNTPHTFQLPIKFKCVTTHSSPIMPIFPGYEKCMLPEWPPLRPQCIISTLLITQMCHLNMISHTIRHTMTSLRTIDQCLDSQKAPHLLTHKQLEMHRCTLSTVATDALVLKHQAISIYSAD